MVTVRSYSCISGTTSEDNEIGMPGSTFCASALIRSSWRSLANELISETVSASMFCALSVCRLATSASSSSGSTTSPRALMRSLASMVQARGAIGGVLL